MSTSIDDRIVEMRFDNKQFEKGAGESIKTLEKLRENLKLENAEQGFDRLEKASKRLSFDHVSDALDAVRDKFSIMGTFADQVIRNIANGFTDLVGKAGQFVKSMSIDQISGGWNQYQNKIQSVQTMMQALPGVSEDEINKALDKLTWYGDETSYSVEQMVDAVSKFTGAGAGLDDSVLAAQGIAGWLATAGVNAQRAQGAFVNLSQAMGKGALVLEDWRTLTTLNATTLQFRKNLLQAGLEMGTLEQRADGVYVAGTKTLVTAEGIEETLSKKWATKDVMLQTFAKYGEFSDQLYDLYSAADNTLSTSELIDQVAESMGEDYMKMGREAFLAAQQALTFKDAIEATATAVKSKWAAVFEALFGGLSNAKKMWTDLSIDLWDIFAGGLDQVGKNLKAAAPLGGQQAFLNGLTNLWKNLYNIITTVQEAFREIFPPKTAQQWTLIAVKFEIFTKYLKLTDTGLANLKQTAKGVFSIFKIFGQVLGALIGPLFDFKRTGADAFREGAEGILEKTAAMGEAIENFSKSPLFLNFLEKTRKVMTKVYSVMKTITKGVIRFGVTLAKIFTTENPVSAFFKSIIEGSKEATLFVVDLFGSITGIDVSGVKNDIEGFFETVTERAKVARDVFVKFGEKIGETFSSFMDIAKEKGVVSAIGSTIGSVIEDLTVSAVELFGAITGIDVSGATASVSGFFETVRSRAQAVVDVFKEVKDSFATLFSTKIDTDPETFDRLTESFGKFSDGAFIGSQVTTGVENVVQMFVELFGALTGTDVTTATDNIHNFFDGARDVAEKAGAKIQEFIDKIKGVYAAVKEFLVEAFAGIKKSMQQNRADKEGISLEQYLAKNPGQTLWDIIAEDFKAGWESFKTAVGPTFEKMGTWIHDNIGGFDESGLATLKSNFDKIGNFFKETGDKIKEVWDKISPTLKKVWDGVKEFFSKIGAYLTKKPKEVKDGIEETGEAVDEGGSLNVGNLLKLLAAVGVGIIVAKTVKKLFDVVGMLNPVTFMSKVKDVMDGFSEISSAIGKAFKAAVFVALAHSVSVIVSSLLQVASLPKDQVINGLVTIGIIMSMLTLVTNQITGNTTTLSSGQLIGVFVGMSIMMVALAAAVSKLVDTMMIFSKLPSKKLQSCVLALAEIIAALALAIFIMSKVNFDNTGIMNLAKMAITGGVIVAGVTKLAKVVVLLGMMKEDQLTRGMEAVKTLTLMIAAFMLALGYLNDKKAAKQNAKNDAEKWKQTAAVAAVLIGVAAIIASFAAAAMIFSNMSDDQFNKAVVGMAAVVLGLAIVTGGLLLLVNTKVDAKKVTAVAGAIAVAAGSLLIASLALLMLKDVNPGTAIVTAISLALMMVSVAGALFLLSKTDANAGKVVGVAGAIAIAMASIAVVALALSVLAKQPLDQILTAAIAVGLIFVALATALGVIANMDASGGKLTAVAASIILLSTSLLIIAAAIKMLSAIDPKTLTSTLIKLGLALAGLAVVAVLANYMAPGFIVLSAALLALGASIMMAGAGVKMVGDGLLSIVLALEQLSDPAKMAALSTLIDTLISKIPALADAVLTVLFVTLPMKMIEQAGTLTAALLTVLTTILDGLLESLPTLIGTFMQLIIEIFKQLNEHGPELIEQLMLFLVNLLTGIAEHTAELVGALIQIILGIIKGIADNLVDIVMGLFDLIIAAINALAETIREKTGPLVDSLWNLGSAMVESIVITFKRLWAHITELFNKITDGTFTKKLDELKTKVKEKVRAIMEAMRAKIQEFKEKIRKAAQAVFDKFIKPVLELRQKVINKVKEALNKAIEWIKTQPEEWKNKAHDLIHGFIDGISNLVSLVVDKVKEMCGKAIDAVKNFFGIKSPSKLMRQMGEYVDEGFAKGIEENSGNVEDSMSVMGKDSLMAMDDALQSAYDLLESDADPTITPVLDLSRIQNGVDQMNAMFGSRRVSLDSAAAATRSSRNNGMSELAASLKSMPSATENNTFSINVYGAPGQDVNQLADAVVNKINNTLNRRKAVFA